MSGGGGEEEANENALPVTSCENKIVRVGCCGSLLTFWSHFVDLASSGKSTVSVHNMRSSPRTAGECKITCSSHFGDEAFTFFGEHFIDQQHAVTTDEFPYLS